MRLLQLRVKLQSLSVEVPFFQPAVKNYNKTLIHLNALARIQDFSQWFIQTVKHDDHN